MLCSKCKKENLFDAKVCSGCGAVLENIPNNNTAKICRLSVIALILGLISPFTLFISAPFALISGAFAINEIKKSNGLLKGIPLAAAGMILPVVFFIVLFLIAIVTGVSFSIISIIKSADSKNSKVLKVETEQKVPAEQTKSNLNILEFRIAPNLGSENREPKISKEVFTGLREDLIKFGPCGKLTRDSNYEWLEINTKSFRAAESLPTGIYGNNKYLLLCKKQPYTMQPYLNDLKLWGLLQVEESIDSQGRPSISFELDNIGSGLFYGLTKSNIGNRLGIVIRDKVVSAPLIQSAIDGKGEIQGQFTIEEIIEMVTSLQKGLSEKKFWEW